MTAQELEEFWNIKDSRNHWKKKFDDMEEQLRIERMLHVISVDEHDKFKTAIKPILAEIIRLAPPSGPLWYGSDTMNKARAVLDCENVSAPDEEHDGWQPIKTAPGDGKVFVAYATHDAGGFQFMAVRRTDGKIACMMSGDVIKKLTHWRPQFEYPTDDTAVLKSEMASLIHSLENAPVEARPDGASHKKL